MNLRPTIDETMMEVAFTLKKRGTCGKKKCGCVLTDARGIILAASYNGNAAGQPHCIETPCAGLNAPPGSDLCEAVHAEQNALTRCEHPDRIWTCYVTAEPCMRCTKQLLNTTCTRIVWVEPYGIEPQAAALWRASGRMWVQMVPDPLARANTDGLVL